MKDSFLILIFTALFSSQAWAVIYGSDDRQDIHHVPHLRSAASSIAVTVPKIFIKPHDTQTFRVEDVGTFGTSSGTQACSSERFADQPVFDVGTCTGFLVDEKHLVTAGHCILPNGIVDNDLKHPFCESFSWYFDFNTAAGPQSTQQIIKKKNLYRCVRVVRAETIQLDSTGANPGNDFAILELDRRVEGATALKLSKAQVALKQRIFTIGHPFGLPAKFSGLAPIHTNTSAYEFNANLDTFGGNSGSPVFDTSKNVVGILVGGHPVDLSFDHRKKCSRLNHCDASGSKCIEDSTFPWLTKSSQVQRLAPLFKYLPAH